VTISYYDQNAENFFDNTVDADLSKLYQEFLPLVIPKSFILDAGCGSGRDSKFFLSKGYNVTAFDASKELALKACAHAGLDVGVTTFDKFESTNLFDGIWACSSLLHVPSNQINSIFSHLSRFLKKDGVFYCSFKYGAFDIERDGRYFTNADEERLSIFIENTGLVIKNTWITDDVRRNRQAEKWLNAILLKAK
jgi:SAM-dependent methyltransferase